MAPREVPPARKAAPMPSTRLCFVWADMLRDRELGFLGFRVWDLGFREGIYIYIYIYIGFVYFFLCDYTALVKRKASCQRRGRPPKH